MGGGLFGITVPVAGAEIGPEFPASPPGSAGKSTYGLFTIWWVNYGFMSPPADTSTAQGQHVLIPITTTAYSGFPMPWFFSKHVRSVSVREYVGPGLWAPLPVQTPTITEVDPTASFTVDLGVANRVGTRYVQFSVTYTDGHVIRSGVVALTTVPKPVNATDLAPTATPPTIFWGQSAAIAAHLMPDNSTGSVTWSLQPAAAGTLNPADGTTTQLTPKDVQPNDPYLQYNPAGLQTTLQAQVTNPDGSRLTRQTQVIIGGLTPQTAAAGSTFSYRPAALNPAAFPAGATVRYQWTLQKPSRQSVSPPGTTLNQPDFRWTNIPGNAAGEYFLQLTVIFTTGGHDFQWVSNVTTLWVNPAAIRLRAVPNLTFMLAGGGGNRVPTGDDLNAAAGTMLVYQAGQTRTGAAFDGNDQGRLLVDGSQWSLAVAVSPFTNTATNAPLNVTPILELTLNGTRQTIPADGGSITVLKNQRDALAAAMDDQTTLLIPQTPLVPPGTYQADVTWTVTTAP
ncbi:hypothetical protein L248_0935 [Schleiferilactobacillus shenzhenensis LY-73]|uniref:Uncharacterized protein n=1 Tax=Schleiferilactobacillus shenzhenensis LY-73 TaxID=1231336 RepID=U4TR80_9LACO|nr:hypothetical protein L248_0935 [Schleiferilactobacillus shenzhenensis LY-73]